MNRKSFPQRTLIAFALAAAGASALPAAAAPIVVLDRVFPHDVRVTGTQFDVDEGTARVGISVNLYDESFEGNAFSETVAVPGLSFDRERREVRYERDGSTVTCAVRKKFLWAATYEPSGACPITVRSEPRIVDDGFGVRAFNGWVVEMRADGPARSAGLKR